MLRRIMCARESVYIGILLVLGIYCVSPVSGQVSVLTHHYDNARTGQNTNETILTHGNVKPATFGKLFTQNLDGFEAGQPLYVPNVVIGATHAPHNVVYVATLHDSVYAFDAQDKQGANALPLWHVNFLDPANGITTVPVADENCIVSGYSEFGINGTPVVDLSRHAIYVLAMTKENGAYVHKLHALDLSTGAELFGGPVTITASFVSQGNTYHFVDKYQQQRPGLLLQNGIVYIGFGGPGCNYQNEMGWVMAYDGGTLQQVGVFNVSPGVKASAIWMSGAGLAGDGAGNVYFSTGDGLFDQNIGGGHFGDSVLKLSQGNGVLNFADYFTPYNQQFLQAYDFDLSSGQLILIPDTGLAVASGKNGTLYLLNQANLGQFNPDGDFQIPQELTAPVLGEVHAGLTYWNGNIYLLAEQTPPMAYSFANGQLSLQPIAQGQKATANPTGGIVSSNGTQDGILWYATFPTDKLFAYDATDVTTELYDSGMTGTRDLMTPLVHFTMPIVANGRVYVNGQTQLTVFGLLPTITVLAGNNQTGEVGTPLPIPLKIGLQDPYSGKPIQRSGVPITFTASGNQGSFSNPNPTTDSMGIASTNYTLPTKVGSYTITASSIGYANATFTVTASTGIPATIAISSGNLQSAQVTTTFASPLKVRVKDAQGNGVPGVSVSFSDGDEGGLLSPPIATTDLSGFAGTSYTAGTESGTVKISASTSGLAPVIFKETVLAGPAASLAIHSGNNQDVAPGAPTAKLLQVIIKDQYGNPVKGMPVTFSDNGANGSFSVNPAITSAQGVAGTRYTAPLQTGTVTITASASGLTPVNFTVHVQ
jgi:hypothetical protein